MRAPVVVATISAFFIGRDYMIASMIYTAGHATFRRSLFPHLGPPHKQLINKRQIKWIRFPAPWHKSRNVI